MGTNIRYGMTYEDDFKEKFGMSIEEWRDETDKEVKRMNFEHAMRDYRQAKIMDPSPTRQHRIVRAFNKVIKYSY